ncbi:hypothetical protein CsSME_00045150 [Camellia sinensis var. sinensis]
MGVAVVLTRRWTPQHATAFLPAFPVFPHHLHFVPKNPKILIYKKKKRLILWLRLLRLPAMEQQLTKGSHTR